MVKKTLATKHTFERHTLTFGVKIEANQADNGRFSNINFKEDCLWQ